MVDTTKILEEDVKKYPVVNLTPHDIVVYDEDKKTIKTILPRSGYVARVDVMHKYVDSILINDFCKVERFRSLYNNIVMEGSFGSFFSFVEEGVVYVVSLLVLNVMREILQYENVRWIYSNKNCVMAPDTGSTAVRNEKGDIIGVTRFLVA